ncbi:MAG TPA: hypothetical protein VE842_04600 [Pyrinomonadaceae bacterium]|jgi:hypothetical protein|nr:hypothetical protein [Pyrinomonadaceae bacterium]
MIVIVGKPGQLGNSLFLFANFLACACENGLKVADPAFDEYAEYFQTTSRDLFCRYPARASLFKGNRRTRKLVFSFSYYLTRLLLKSPVKTPYLRVIEIDWDETVRLDHPEFLGSASRRGILFAQGWQFRDRTNFTKHAAAIRAYFEPLEVFQHNVSTVTARAREKCDLLVGVHIRHGDYKKFLGGKYFYEIEDYARLMERVERQHEGKRVGFLICSNARLRGADFSRFNFTFGTDHLIEDMYSLAKCDLILGPPSTYTMWAAFYGNVPLYMIEDIDAEPRFDAGHTFLSADK